MLAPAKALADELSKNRTLLIRWKDLGVSVAPKQQAIYVMAPREIEDKPLVSKLYFNLTPVFAQAQTLQPEMLFSIQALPSVDLTRFGRTGSLNSIEDWFSFVYSLTSPDDDSMEKIIVSLLVLAAFAGPHLQQSVVLRPYLTESLDYLDKGNLRKEAKIFQEAQRILRTLF